MSSPSDPKSPRPQAPSEATTSSGRRPLDEVKPPREWRVHRRPGKPSQAVRNTESRAASAPAQPVAGSSLPQPAERPPEFGSGGGSEMRVRGEPRPAPVATEAVPEIPHRYGVDRLVLLVRDPYWVYAWWELTDPTTARGRASLQGDAALVLRFYDISLIDWDGANHHESFDVEVDDPAGSWYVELDKPGASFCAELGLRHADGRFLALVRSNTVSLPRDSMSPEVDEEWRTLEAEYRRLFELSGGGSIGLGSGEILRALEERLRSELASGGLPHRGSGRDPSPES